MKNHLYMGIGCVLFAILVSLALLGESLMHKKLLLVSESDFVVVNQSRVKVDSDHVAQLFEKYEKVLHSEQKHSENDYIPTVFTAPDLDWDLKTSTFVSRESINVRQPETPNLRVLDFQYLPFRFQIRGFVDDIDTRRKTIILIVEDLVEGSFFRIKSDDDLFFSKSGYSLESVDVEIVENPFGGIEHIAVVILHDTNGELIELRSGQKAVGNDFILNVELNEQRFAFGADRFDFSTEAFHVVYDQQSVFPAFDFIVTNLSTSESCRIRKHITPSF